MSNYLELLTPQNSQLIIIDQQPQMAFGVQSIDRQMLKNNVVALAKSAKVFKVPTTITTVETEGFSGHAYPELRKLRPGLALQKTLDFNHKSGREGSGSSFASATAAIAKPERTRSPRARFHRRRRRAPSPGRRE